MEDKHLVEPDLNFIEEIRRNGGDSLKKCFQCATCAVACKLSSDHHPFPRKEMIYASWGLKDRLLGNPDIWLCHNCGDCSTLCPRGAKPGDTLGAIRRLSIKAYSKPDVMNRLLGDPKLAPFLLVLPALVILAVGYMTGLLSVRHNGDAIVYAHYFPVTLIEIIFIPLSILIGVVFFLGIRRMLADMQANYSRRGLSDSNSIEPVAFLRVLIANLPAIIKHEKFATCTQTRSRKRSHMLVSFSFFNLASVAGAFVLALYLFNSHGPYSQLNPIKIFANLSGIALIYGSILLILDRLKQSTDQNTYFDWYLLVLALLLGVTGMLTQFVRLLGWPSVSLGVYFLHLILALNLIAFLPYTKMAHFVYRTVAITYCAYARNENRSKR